VAGDVANIVTGAAATVADAHTVHTSRVARAATPPPNPVTKVSTSTAVAEPHGSTAGSASGRAAGEAGRKAGERTGDVLDEASKSRRVKLAKKAAEAAEAAIGGAEGAAVTGGRTAAIMRVGAKVAGRAAIPLAVAVGGVETYTATRAGRPRPCHRCNWQHRLGGF